MQSSEMDLRALKETPPWDWPEETGEMLLDLLRKPGTSEPDRLIAAELAGDFTVIDDELTQALLSILRSASESASLRGQAAISLGPILDHADTYGFDDPDDVPVTEKTFDEMQEALQKLFADESVATVVRRRILEASVRAAQDWHVEAIRTAYASSDKDWKLTAVFCMRFVRGFDEQILEALKSDNPEIHFEAVSAAGTWEVEGAWDHVKALVQSKKTEKTLLLAAIEAVAGIRPDEAEDVLGDLLDSSDEEIVDAVNDAIAMAEGDWDDDDEDEDEEGDL